MVILLVYVDDIIITGTDSGLITKLQQVLHATFHMKDLGQLMYILGMEVHHRPNDIFLNQLKYIQDIITLVGLEDTSSVATPMEINVKYRKDEGALLHDPTIYRCLVESLIYLATTHPDIFYVIHQVSSVIGLVAYNDADWAGCPDTHRSTTVSSYYPAPLHADNTSAIQIAANPVFH
ncbi:uncharacterized mitochondrial protein AtMg00810-like [Aristolochia californica]|uniref:uncharacterized mitochondrial protein AtMg00810-like n=1 Tax=Aristolochia californica TaxID=171875 RepID=UPI0035D9AFC3